jgi:G:T/U-mismatch repair DNA glycosylase
MNNKEIHPYLNEGNIKGCTKLILGSFPVYACTNPDNIEKLTIRNTEGTVRFFYGSCKSRFWGLYHQFIDNNVTVPIKKEIAIDSLKKHKIAISDTIKSCKRKGTSALDSDLTDIDYNIEMIQKMIKSGVTMILCTSKGVLSDLNKRILLPLEGMKIDEQKTKQFESEIIANLKGTSKSIKKPICIVYKYNKRLIYTLAIPSPGSPQRQAHSFGWKTGYKTVYANNYFQYAFKWLKK